MLIYNFFIAIVALLLWLDYLVENYQVSIAYRSRRFDPGNTFLYLTLLIVILFAGFRYGIGYDYNEYLAGFQFDDELERWEPLFRILVLFSRNFDFGLDIQAMFLYFSILTLLIVYKALKSLTPYYRMGLLLYFLIPSLFLNSFSVIRQGVAIALMLYALQYITMRINYWKYILLAFAAMMFHSSAIVAFAVYFFGRYFFDRLHPWGIYLFLILGSFFLSFAHIGKIALALLPGHFSLYADIEIGVSILKLVVVNAFFLFFLFQKDSFVKTRLDRYAFNSIFLGLLIFNTFSDFVYVTRMAQYFLALEIILVPVYLHSLKDMTMRKTLTAVFLFYYLFNFNYSLYRDRAYNTRKDPHFLVPYRSYFLEKKKPKRVRYLEGWFIYLNQFDDNPGADDGV